MTLLPIVERELRVAARHGSTYWSRVGAALTGLAIAAYLYLASSQFGQLRLGLALFNALAWISLLYCLLAGPRLTADCISAEKREGTLGLLFLTDLKGYDIVLGKLAASSTRAFYGLLAVFPVLGLALLFGGVTGAQFYQVVLVLLNTLFFSLAAGVFASVWFQRWSNAAGLSFLLVVGLSVGPVACFVLTTWLWRASPMAYMHLMVPSPGFALALAADPGARGAPVYLFWPSVASTHVLGWLLLGGASLVLPGAWRDRPASATRLHWRARWRQWCYGNGAARAAFRRRLLEINPFFWLAARDRLKPAYVWVFLSLVAAGCLYGWLYYPDLREHLIDLLVVVSVVVHGALKLWLCTAVVHRLAEDRQSGTLELILSTPLTTRELFWGQRRALWRQFAGPLVAVVAADILFCYLSLRREYMEHTILGMLYGAHVLILFADVYTISWLGLWAAVTAKRPSHAAAAVLNRVLVLPWFVFITLSILFETLRLEYRWGWDMSEKQVLAIWFGIALANDIFFLVYAGRRLAYRFRAAATQRFEARRRGFWTWLFGGR